MRQIYFWDEWFASDRVEIVRGRDYDVPQSSMCQMVRNNAARRGVRVKLLDRGDRIVIWVVKSSSASIPGNAAPLSPSVLVAS